MKNFHQPFFEKGNTEFYGDAGIAHAIIEGENVPIQEWPVQTLQIISKDMERHPGAISALEKMGITEGIDQINQYTLCMYGEFNLQPDFINYKANSNDAEFCQLICGVKDCRYRGVLCQLIHADYGDLTEREIQICQLLARDLTSQEIAYRLGISINTLNTHITNILPKIGVKNSRGIAVWAVHHLPIQ